MPGNSSSGDEDLVFPSQLEGLIISISLIFFPNGKLRCGDMHCRPNRFEYLHYIGSGNHVHGSSACHIGASPVRFDRTLSIDLEARHLSKSTLEQGPCYSSPISRTEGHLLIFYWTAR